MKGIYYPIIYGTYTLVQCTELADAKASKKTLDLNQRF